MHSAIIALVWASLVKAITLPQPFGNHGVYIQSLQLIDKSRSNPWEPQPEWRSLIVSIFHPVCCKNRCTPSSVQYMPNAIAEYYDGQYAEFGVPNGKFGSIQQPSCQVRPNRLHRHEEHDNSVLLFSPGLGVSRFLYSALAAEIASHGISVVTVDHPYDAPVVEFPDGTIITAANISTNDQIDKALRVRSEDLSFLASEIRNSNLPLLHHVGHEKVFAAGHSLGGATAVDAMSRVSNIDTAVNVDGSFWGRWKSNDTTTVRPVLLIQRENKDDQTWDSVWPRLLGSKLQVSLFGSQHGTFTDLSYLVDVLGFREKLPKQVTEDLIGSIDGTDALTAVADVVVAWLKGVHTGREAEMARTVVANDENLQVVRRSSS